MCMHTHNQAVELCAMELHPVLLLDATEKVFVSAAFSFTRAGLLLADINFLSAASIFNLF